MAAHDDPAAPQHARSGPLAPQPPEPTPAERVRTLLAQVPVGAVSTMSRRQRGFPFGSLMPFALDGGGRPLFLISSMAMHTQNLEADARTSLFVAHQGEADPLGAARATVVGTTERLPPEELAAARELYLQRHPNSRNWVEYSDFRFYRLQPVEVYYVGGFGVMGWITADEYRNAEADPLAEAAAGILTHMNADHTEAMLLLARSAAGLQVTEAAMTAVDRLGFTLRLKTEAGFQALRLNFPTPVRSPVETRQALVNLVQTARAQAGPVPGATA